MIFISRGRLFICRPAFVCGNNMHEFKSCMHACIIIIFIVNFFFTKAAVRCKVRPAGTLSLPVNIKLTYLIRDFFPPEYDT